MSNPKQIANLAHLLMESKKVLVLSGAGMSTESGIPDFRTPGGLYSKRPQITLSFPVLKDEPEEFFETFRLFCEAFEGTQPNKGHFALAKLEEMGYIHKIVTQNVDGFHQQAGSNNVLEAHGHLRESICMTCGKVYDFDVLYKQLKYGDSYPMSECCQSTLRPSVTLFYENLPQEFEQFMNNELHTYDFALILGTSLTVYPAANIAGEVNNIAIINKSSTEFDTRAEVVIRDSIGKTLEAVVNYIETFSKQ
jgi:NAD-dependent deacetylase